MSVVAGLKSKVNSYRATQASRATTVEAEYQPDMPHIKEGWMAKKGGVGGQKMWKKRWFVLTTEYLIYCAKQAAPVGPNVKGQVKLSDAYLVETSATKRELCFQLCTPDRTYYFEPLSNTDRAEWIRKLKACLDKRLDTASVLRSGFLLKLGGKVGPLMNSKMIPAALKSPKVTSPNLQEEKSKGLVRDSQKTKWQKRFFVLRMGELCYYVQQRDIFPPEKRKGTILLRGSYIVPESNTDPTHPNAFELIAGDRSYTLDIGEEQGRNMFSNNGDERCATKAEWISSLLFANPTAVFGVPLAVAASRSNSGGKSLVPAPLTMATQWLNLHALREEGLYRIPGSKAEVEKFIRKYDAGEPVMVPENYFGGNLASLVVQFIRRCPENLFTEEFAPLFEKIVNDYNSGVDPAKQLHMLKRLIGMLPAVNLATVRCLLEHLLQVAALSEENHMTSDKLSMCVYAKMAPTIGLCMSKYEELFGSLETNVGLETTNDVARLVEETEQKAARERQARQERDEREEIARLKKLGLASPSASASEADDSDDDDHKIEAKPTSGGLKCSCGSLMEDIAIFCGDCGKPVEKKAEVKPEKKVATNTRRGLEFGELKCPSCGEPAEPGTTFCEQCGAKIPSLDSMSNSPKAALQQKREDSPAPRKLQQSAANKEASPASPSPTSSPASTINNLVIKRSGSNTNFNKYPLSPFQPERDRVATLETINTPAEAPAESMSMLEALKIALPNKADKWADWVAKLSASGINHVGDLKAMEVEKLASLDCPALLKSVLNRIRSGDPMPANRASDAVPLKCACGETNVAGAAYCEKCGSKIQSIVTGPRFSFSVPLQPATARPTVSNSVAASAAAANAAKNTKAPPPPPFSGNAALPTAAPAPAATPAATATATATKAPATTASATPNSTASTTEKKCPSCNAVCEPSTSFCEQCGFRLGPVVAKQSIAVAPTQPVATPTATATTATTATTTTATQTRTPGRLTTFTPVSASTSSSPSTTPSPTVGPNIVNRPFPGRTVTSGSSGPSTTTTTATSRPTVSRTGASPPSAASVATTTAATTTTATTTTAATSATATPATTTAVRTTVTAGNAVAQRMNAFSVSGGLKCGSCGEPHAASATFCDQCGNKLGGAPAASRWNSGAVRTGPAVTNTATTTATTTATATTTPVKTWGNNNTTNSVASRFPAANATTTTSSASSTTTTARPTISTASSPSSNAFNKPPVSPSAGARPTIVATPTASSLSPSPSPSPSTFGRVNPTPTSPAVGRTVSPTPSPSPSPSANKPSPAPAPRASIAGAKCPSCGKTAPPGDAFCDQCGAKLAGASSPSPSVAPLVRTPSVARRVQSPFLK